MGGQDRFHNNQNNQNQGDGFGNRPPAFHNRYNMSGPAASQHGYDDMQDGQQQQQQQQGDRYNNDDRAGGWNGPGRSPPRDGNANFEGGQGQWQNSNRGGGGGMMDGGEGREGGGPGFHGDRMNGPGGASGQEMRSTPPPPTLQPPPPPGGPRVRAGSPALITAPVLSGQVGGRGELRRIV